MARAAPPPSRSPLIERLIARASFSARIADWRADAFGLLNPPAAPRPAVLEPVAPGPATPGIRDAAPGAWVCVATPVHWRAGMTRVSFPIDGILQLDSDDASTLARDFNAAFDGAGARLEAGRAGQLFCVFDEPLDVTTQDPEAAVGEDVFGFQPTGRDAPRLRRLMSEMEMWLFDHAVNRRRTARSLPPITGLWLWGGGGVSSTPPSLAVWSAQAPPESQSGLVTVNDHPGSATWPDVERLWLQPAVLDLTAGRIEQVHLSAARRRFTLTPGFKLRFWRRPRAWWESFD